MKKADKCIKKINLFAVFIFICLLNIPVYASTVVLNVEGENYTSATFTPTIVSGKGFSNGSYLQVRHGLEKGARHEVSYEFEVNKAGRYGLETIASIFNVGYTTDYIITINDETKINVPTTAVKLEDIATNPMNNVFKRYYLGNYYFHEGTNKITFIMDDDDRADVTNFVTTFIDCFSLISEDFAIGSITVPNDLNIYESGNSVRFDITFKGVCPKEEIFEYKLVDNWGMTVEKGKLTCREGSDSKSFYTKKLDTGYYKLKITDINGKEAFRDVSLAVVPKESQRIKCDSPFAMDFAGTDVVANVESVSKLAKAARLAGVQWVRERFQWARMQPSAEKKYEFDRTDKFIDAISGEGLKILDIFYGNPTWRKDTDLFDLYYAIKAAAEHYGDKVSAWEMYNEVDGNFQSWSGDTYSSIFKAMSIGAVDSGANPKISFGGLCRFVEGDKFIDLQTKNMAMDYSDIYNLHFHITENDDIDQNIMFNHFKSHRELKFHTGTDGKEFWITEAGIYQNQENGELSDEQRQKTARYLVTSTAQSLSTGTSKHFWFILSPYVESKVKDMGIFNNFYEPTPAYVAEAVMTNTLGAGKYKGQIEMTDAEGHLFDSGRGDVLTIWTDKPRFVEINSDKPVKVTNIMGKENTVYPEKGKVKVSISHYPIYINFDGEMSKDDYYPVSFNHDDSLKVTFNDAQRVVLRQDFADFPQEVAKGGGYKINLGEETEFSVHLYNFNNKQMKGKLYGELDGYDVLINNDITIEPMSEISVPAVLREKETQQYGSEKYLKLYAEFDGEKTSPSVSIITLEDNEPEEPGYINKAALDPSKWDVTNITAGASAVAYADPNEEGVINFDLKFNGGGKWFYPFIDLDIDPQKLQEYDGFIYWMRVTRDEDVFKGTPNLFAYLSDGRKYYIGQETGITQKTSWVKVKRRWKDLILFYSPLGVEVDLRPFDPTLITHIGIGTNPSKNTLSYQIKGVGYFKSGIEDSESEINEIEFASPDLKTVRDKNKLSNVVINLPEGEYKKITLMLTDEVFTNYKFDKNTVYADLSDINKGKYILRVMAEDIRGFVKSNAIDITID